MIEPIKMNSISDPYSFFESSILQSDLTPIDELYTEAVFADGKAKIKPIEDGFGKVKAELDRQISEHTEEKQFDPEAYWKNNLWKELEDTVQKTFNFRHVIIAPFTEKYIAKDKVFETREMNCIVMSIDRYPIDGLVSDKGFYDSTRSCQIEIYPSLGLIKALSPAELTAVFLHEFGHGIDPALVDIKYTETNVLSKYLTDRKKEIKEGEKKALKTKSKFKFLTALFHVTGSEGKFLAFIKSIITSVQQKGKIKMATIWPWEHDKSLFSKIENELHSDKTRFTRQEYAEAYADNFARMYGYGVHLSSALKKMDKHLSEWSVRRIKNEKARQREITKIVLAALKDEHKTTLTRALAIEREMNADINDPNTPPKVKEQLREDLKELQLVIKSYKTDFSGFQAKCHELIIDDFRSKESAPENKEEKKE